MQRLGRAGVSRGKKNTAGDRTSQRACCQDSQGSHGSGPNASDVGFMRNAFPYLAFDVGGEVVPVVVVVEVVLAVVPGGFGAGKLGHGVFGAARRMASESIVASDGLCVGSVKY